MLESGTILQSRYKIVEPLGQGGMGAVYRALDLRLRTTVALKETTVEGEAFRKAFEREAHLLAALRHPALPVVSDHFTESKGQFLVMQFIPGEDLSKLLEKSCGPFPLSVVLKWADDLLDALDYLHSRSPAVLHRDIKPQNLKLTERGEMILLDFGLARGTANSQGRSQLSAGSSVLGFTLAYAPLEQIEGSGGDPRSDLYAAAATLYHFITYARPADALARVTALVSGRPDPLRPASELNPLVPHSVSSLLEAALALSVEDRPASAALLRKGLRDARRTTDLLGEPESDTTFFRKAPHSSAPLVQSPPTGNAAVPPTAPPAAGVTIFGGAPGGAPRPHDEPTELETRLRASSALPGEWHIPLQTEVVTRVDATPAPAPAALPTRPIEFTFVTLNEAGREDVRQTSVVDCFVEDLGGGVTIALSSIPGGAYRMGVDADPSGRDARLAPAHDVSVKPFFLSRLPVTQAQWRAVAELPMVKSQLEFDPSHFKGADRPVEKVSWGDCQEFCSRLSRRTGRSYRLPTEAEWEYACRAGTTTPFHFGSTINADVVNYDGSFSFGSGPKGKFRKETTPAGGLGVANSFGLFDMHGNVWEWCEDVWHESYVGAPADGHAWNTGGIPSECVVRGGSWYGRPDYCRSASRVGAASDGRNGRTGFRVVLSLF